MIFFYHSHLRKINQWTTDLDLWPGEEASLEGLEGATVFIHALGPQYTTDIGLRQGQGQIFETSGKRRLLMRNFPSNFVSRPRAKEMYKKIDF